MRIDELTIQNFKCFENETFRFDPHFNVVIGKNGSGKSSLLDAVAVAASSYLSGIIGETRGIKPIEIRTSLIEGQPKPQIPTLINSLLVFDDKSFDINIKGEPHLLLDPKQNTKVNLEYGIGFSQLNYFALTTLKESRQFGNKIIFPILAFYETGRLLNKRNSVNYFKQGEGVYSTYPDFIVPNHSNDVFLSWFKTYEDEVKKFKQPLDELFLKVFK